MSKPGKVLRNLCKKLRVRLTVKRGKKRVYKSVAVLKRQCSNKKKKVVKRRRRFGMHSIVDEVGTYIGGIKNGKRHGLGKMKYNIGGIYIGNWENGFEHGKGKVTLTNGNVFGGEFKYGKANGEGKMAYANGAIYEGEYKDSKKNGQGKYTYADGSVYEGGWKDNNRHGQGVYYDYLYSTKTIIKGRWEYDTHQTGDVYKFKDLFDDESLTTFKHIKRTINGDETKSSTFGEDALSEFYTVLKSFMREGFGKKRRKRSLKKNKPNKQNGKYKQSNKKFRRPNKRTTT